MTREIVFCQDGARTAQGVLRLPDSNSFFLMKGCPTVSVSFVSYIGSSKPEVFISFVATHCLGGAMKKAPKL